MTPRKPAPAQTIPAGRGWTVEFDDRARRELRKLAPETQQAILRYLRERIAGAADPEHLAARSA